MFCVCKLQVITNDMFQSHWLARSQPNRYGLQMRATHAVQQAQKLKYKPISNK
ncbi:hypothetical protein Hanom_Chr16g01444421 [Helianthus anomalus]